MLNALSDLERHGKIIHRDIKPQNILISSFDRQKKTIQTKLADFGTSKSIETMSAQLTGTPYYFAPEVLNGMGFSVASDIYALGITLYYLAAGEPPFKTMSQTVESIIAAILMFDG